jgi:signal transduction histidine kinase
MILFRVWVTARFWKELAYLISGVLVRLPPFLVAVLGIAACGLSVVVFGLALLAGVLALARLTPQYLRASARKLVGWDWPNAQPVSRNPLTDSTAWRAMLYCFIGFFLVYSGAYLTLLAMGSGLAALTYPAWWFVSHNPWSLLDTADSQSWAQTWVEAVKGLGLLLVVPWFVRLIVLADAWLVRTLLHPSRAAKRIAQLEAGRTALQADSAALLRRVERDLHDGTQARLVTLGVQLARIEHKTADPAVRDLAADSRQTVAEALAELRDIVRGLHPPALDDGLEVALSTLAGRSAVPAEVTVRLAGRPPDATPSAIYFTVAELLTNAARHAAATRAWISLTDDPKRLTLTVRDNGHGGAAVATDPPSAPATTGAAQHGTAQHGTAQHGTAQHGTAQHGTAQHGTATTNGADRFEAAATGNSAPRGPVAAGGSPHRGADAAGDPTQRGTDAAGDPTQRGADAAGDSARRGTGAAGGSDDGGAGVAGDSDRRGKGAAGNGGAGAVNGRGGGGANGSGDGGGAGDGRRGTGLAGLRRRAEALDGELRIASPVGGPTTVTMTLPREY